MCGSALQSRHSRIHTIIITMTRSGMCSSVSTFHVCFTCCRKAATVRELEGRNWNVQNCIVFAEKAGSLVLSSQMMINFVWSGTICHLRNLCDLCLKLCSTSTATQKLLLLISCHGSFAGFCRSLWVFVFFSIYFSFVCEIVHTSDSRERYCTIKYAQCAPCSFIVSVVRGTHKEDG